MEVTQFSVPVDGVDKKNVSKAFTMFLLSNVKQFIPAGGAGGKIQKQRGNNKHCLN